MSERAPLEVTIVANDIGPRGGMELQLTELITGLLDSGVEVTVISWTCHLPEHPRLRWVRVPGPSRPFAIAYPWFLLVASLLTRLKGRGVVHSTGAIVLNRVGVCTVHYCHRAATQASNFSRASQGGVAYRLNARISEAMKRLGERFVYRPGRVGRLVGVSEGVADELRDHYPAMRDRAIVIPNGVDTEMFHPPSTRSAEGLPDRVNALFVGSEWERKGLAVAIEALRHAPEARLTVVGEGHEASFRSLAEDVGVGSRVEFAGPTSDVAPAFRGADVFVLPTAYETFSLVTYEAAASGLPLLVTRVNGVEDLLRDGENGWFVRRDAEDVGARLQVLSRDSALRRSMGEAARRDSLDHSWARVVERYEGVYREAGA